MCGEGSSSHPPSMENLALLVVVVNIKIKQKIKILGFYASVSNSYYDHDQIMIRHFILVFVFLPPWGILKLKFVKKQINLEVWFYNSVLKIVIIRWTVLRLCVMAVLRFGLEGLKDRKSWEVVPHQKVHVGFELVFKMKSIFGLEHVFLFHLKPFWHCPYNKLLFSQISSLDLNAFGMFIIFWCVHVFSLTFSDIDVKNVSTDFTWWTYLLLSINFCVIVIKMTFCIGAHSRCTNKSTCGNNSLCFCILRWNWWKRREDSNCVH